ncbi:hypothetical protein ARMSODRAFT_1020770 [Armillaria solidipes]|uniref:Uncharacterized protein n=1 Tax=Armillaria solidipes TaxID=1076256 RepID=A0A2H3BMP2_9AGAR|nr:hypothetical protein ARMSODRAFT_1020770 [Armillaria solidipes]
MLGVTFSAALTVNPVEHHGSNELVKRAQLSDGTHSLEAGNINKGLSWMSSGILLSSLETPAKTYRIAMWTPRQRIEFWTPGVADGTTQKFKWRFYLSSQTKTTKNFFHLMQVLSRGDGGPIVTLDAVNDRIMIKDYKRDCDVTGCPSIPLDRFTDRTTVHFVTVTFGPKGSLEYVIKDAADESVALLSYSVKGAMGSDSSSIKFGTYHLAVDGMTKSLAYAGDFVDESDS